MVRWTDWVRLAMRGEAKWPHRLRDVGARAGGPVDQQTSDLRDPHRPFGGW